MKIEPRLIFIAIVVESFKDDSQNILNVFFYKQYSATKSYCWDTIHCLQGFQSNHEHILHNGLLKGEKKLIINIETNF